MDLIESTPKEGDPARRQRRLLLIAWSATVLPLVAFAYLTWEAVQAGRQVAAARTELAGVNDRIAKARADNAALEEQIERTQKTLEEQRQSTKHYRDFAGVRIQFYRESDRAVVEQALKQLGFRIETSLGTAPLIARSPNTIAYGKLVSEQDLRDIAVALVQAKFPLRSIVPATVRPDPKLIQIFASARADRECGLLTEEAIRAGSTCGAK